jgi:hypothetical protein
MPLTSDQMTTRASLPPSGSAANPGRPEGLPGAGMTRRCSLSHPTGS